MPDTYSCPTSAQIDPDDEPTFEFRDDTRRCRMRLSVDLGHPENAREILANISHWLSVQYEAALASDCFEAERTAGEGQVIYR